MQGLGSGDQICTGVRQACVLCPSMLALNVALIMGGVLQLRLALILCNDLQIALIRTCTNAEIA